MRLKRIACTSLMIFISMLASITYAQECWITGGRGNGRDFKLTSSSPNATVTMAGRAEVLYNVYQVRSGSNYEDGDTKNIDFEVVCQPTSMGSRSQFDFFWIGTRQNIWEWTNNPALNMDRQNSKVVVKGTVNSTSDSSEMWMEKDFISGAFNLGSGSAGFPYHILYVGKGHQRFGQFYVKLRGEGFQIASTSIPKVLTLPPITNELFQVRQHLGVGKPYMQEFLGYITFIFHGEYAGCTAPTYTVDYPNKVSFGTMQGIQDYLDKRVAFDMTLKSGSTCRHELKPSITFEPMNGKLINNNRTIEIGNGLGLSLIDKTHNSTEIVFNTAIQYSQLRDGVLKLPYEARLTRTGLAIKNGAFSTNVKFTIEYR